MSGVWKKTFIGRVWWEIEKRRDHLEDPDIVGMTIIKWILKKWGVIIWSGLTWPGQGQVVS